MNEQTVKKENAVPRLQLFNCAFADCGATFTRQWRLEEHKNAHSGAVSPSNVGLIITKRLEVRI